MGNKVNCKLKRNKGKSVCRMKLRVKKRTVYIKSKLGPIRNSWEIGIVNCKKETSTGMSKCRTNRLGGEFPIPHTYDNIDRALKAVKKLSTERL